MTLREAKGWNFNGMAAPSAGELRDGYYVNPGIGIPTLVANNIPEGMTVTLQSENGMVGIGPFPYDDEIDADLINAGKQTISELPSSVIPACSLPLTGKNVVDMIVTDLTVFQWPDHRSLFKLVEWALGVSADEVPAKMTATYAVG